MEYKKRTWPKYFQKILDGEKKYVLRLADWDCKEGDVLILQEWAPETKKYTGREIKKKIISIIKTKEITFWSKEEVEKYGFQIISFD